MKHENDKKIEENVEQTLSNKLQSIILLIEITETAERSDRQQ